ncbi:MAG: hypothetical protein KDG55_11910 [Rhodocyclaceae bacterium]|nr:hypothetical protein [Rhodocyclaceae bacterium]
MDLHDFDSASLYFDEPCPAEVQELMQVAADGYEDGSGELALLQAYFIAPAQLTVLVGLYRFYFYKHRLAEADRVAIRSMTTSGERLGLPDDWTEADEIALACAASRSIGLLRFWLLALKARAILALREGRLADGRRMLDKLQELDRHDRLGAKPLIDVLNGLATEAQSDTAPA